MTTRYQTEHYEDVARMLGTEFEAQKPANLHGPILNLIYGFADLFAADNPHTCCGQIVDNHYVFCRQTDTPHRFEGGFDRTQFLSACGLKS